jgi:hypothetical protein
VHVIALGAGQSLGPEHGMVHSIFVIIAKGSHMPDAQSDAPVHAVQSCASAPPSPPLDEPLLDPELLPLLDPLEPPLLEPLELPELLPLLDPLELPLPEPLSASDPELEPGPLGPDEELLEQAGIQRTMSVEVATARVRRSLMHSRMTSRIEARQLLSTAPREMFHACSFRVTNRRPDGQLGNVGEIENHASRLLSHRAHRSRTRRRRAPSTSTAACSSTRRSPSQRRQPMAVACGSICEDDSTTIGRSGAPPRSRRARRSRSRFSFRAARSRSLRSLRADARRLATPTPLAGNARGDARFLGSLQ